jgi:hypothetical protein
MCSTVSRPTITSPLESGHSAVTTRRFPGTARTLFPGETGKPHVQGSRGRSGSRTAIHDSLLPLAGQIRVQGLDANNTRMYVHHIHVYMAITCLHYTVCIHSDGIYTQECYVHTGMAFITRIHISWINCICMHS